MIQCSFIDNILFDDTLNPNNIRIKGLQRKILYAVENMKRIPKQERSREKYERIIRTMRQLIDGGKFATSSTHAIAKLSGVGVGTVYEYFDSKEDILIALLERETDLIWSRMETDSVRWMNSSNPLAAMAEFVTNFAVEHRSLINIAFGQIAGTMAMPAMVRFMGKIELLISQVLLAERQGLRSETHSNDAFLLTQCLVGIVLGMANDERAFERSDALGKRLAELFA